MFFVTFTGSKNIITNWAKRSQRKTRRPYIHALKIELNMLRYGLRSKVTNKNKNAKHIEMRKFFNNFVVFLTKFTTNKIWFERILHHCQCERNEMELSIIAFWVRFGCAESFAHYEFLVSRAGFTAKVVNVSKRKKNEEFVSGGEVLLLILQQWNRATARASVHVEREKDHHVLRVQFAWEHLNYYRTVNRAGNGDERRRSQNNRRLCLTACKLKYSRAQCYNVEQR